MDGVDALTLARAQFAFTVAFHIVFPAFSIGLASYVAVLNALHLRTGRAVYLALFDYWKTIFRGRRWYERPGRSSGRSWATRCSRPSSSRRGFGAGSGLCLIPWFDGVILSQEWKEALWDKFVTGAPRPRTPSEQQYSDRRLRSRS
jgi:hypothetical protein